MRELLRVTIENPVADVAVLQGPTVAIGLAVAGEGGTETLAFLAGIVKGAGILVIAWCRIVRIQASAFGGAGIIGAQVFIIAEYDAAKARAFVAMVTFGAGIAVITPGAGQRFEETARLPRTTVKGTLVVVVAHDIVDIAVAVVIKAVADIFERVNCVARRKTVCRATTTTQTSAPLVGSLTGGSEAELDGIVRALTDSTFRNALHHSAPFDGQRILALIPSGAGLPSGTIGPAKPTVHA